MTLQDRPRKTNRRGFIFGALAAGAVLSYALILPSPAVADALNDMRASGALGEAFDGFARARKKSAKDFVAEVNAKRRKIYVKRAKAQGVSVDQVGRVYAGQIAKKAPVGTWFLSEDGDWTRKK